MVKQALPCYIFGIVLSVTVFLGMVVTMVLFVLPIGQELGLVANDPMSPPPMTDPMMPPQTGPTGGPPPPPPAPLSLIPTILPPPIIIVAMWIIIFLYSVMWHVYGISLTCRRNNTFMTYLYISPNFMPGIIYLFFMIGCIASVVAVVMFGNAYILIAMCMMAFATIMLWAAVGTSYQAVAREEDNLIRMGHTRDISATRALVQNGLGFFAMWTTLETIFGIYILLQAHQILEWHVVNAVTLGAIGFLIVLYFIVDVAAMDRYSRYLISPYIVMVITVSCIMIVHWQWAHISTILAIVLTVLAVFALVAKLTITIGRYRPGPLHK